LAKNLKKEKEIIYAKYNQLNTTTSQHNLWFSLFQPSSSSQAAELLTASGAAPTGFVGFGQTPKYVPVSSSLDDMDSSLDSDFRLVLRKLTKKDATTKIRVS